MDPHLGGPSGTAQIEAAAGAWDHALGISESLGRRGWRWPGFRPLHFLPLARERLLIRK